LEEWQAILQSDQANTLRDVLANDIQLAQQLVDKQITLEDVV
jgi:hypothetical protein